LDWIAKIIREELALHAEKAEWLPRQQIVRGGPSPIGCIIFLSLFAMVWFGVLAFWIYDTVLPGRADPSEVFPALIFALAGLFLVSYIGYLVCTLFSPRPTISLSDESICLGDTVDVSWHFSRNAGLLRSLEIYLEGEERTKVRCRGRGRMQTVADTFAELPVIESTSNVRSGKLQITIPADTMHSFAADHGGIDWSVQVFADVWLLPNVNVGFPITVLPKRIETRIADNEPDED
jgi:hypothetical protein